MSTMIRVLHLSTHNEECGIAKFQENIVDGMGHQKSIENEFFSISPNKLKLMQGKEFDRALKQLLEQLEAFQILHIQHEYSFYGPGQLQRIVDGAKSINKKIMFTLHTPPQAHRQGIERRAHITMSPRSVLHALRVRQTDNQFVSDYIRPLLLADLLIATSKASIESFVSYGIPAKRMRVIELPVPKVDKAVVSDTIGKAINRQPEDIVLSTTGFLTPMKGVISAIKALKFLPENYKLAIIGGSHPSGQNDVYYDQVCDVITSLNLEKRVYISGYVVDDARRDALLRETQVCLYPYDKNYYDYVSSAALTNAIANGVPIVAYKTKTFSEANEKIQFINFSQSANYYELARSVKNLDLKKSMALTKEYAENFSVEKQATKFAHAYQQLVEK